MSLQVKLINNRPVNSNSFVIFDKDVNNECIVVDPGTADCLELERFLSELSLTPIKIVLTHEHFDHCWGCNYLQNKYNIPIVCSKLCASRVRHHKTNYSVFYNPLASFDINGEIKAIGDGVTLDFYRHNLKFMIVQGHTDSSMVIELENHLFTGDALINGLKTVTKLPGGSKQKAIESHSFFESYKGKGFLVHPGHLEEFYLDECNLVEILK